MPALTSAKLFADESHSGSDSEYWAAMEDTDFSDATINTGGGTGGESSETEEEEESGQDFH